MNRLLARTFERLRIRLELVVQRAIVKTVNDSGGLQILQVVTRASEIDGAERIQPYGLTSVPSDGDEGIALLVGGNRDHVYVLGPDSRSRPKDKPAGTVILYSPVGGQQLEFKPDGSIDLQAAIGQLMKLIADTIELGDGVGGQRLCTESLITWLLNHTHDYVTPPREPLAPGAPMTTEKTKAT